VRTCPKCGRQNPDDRDFCECGEYLRWDPTQYIPAMPAPAQPSETPAGDDPPAPARPSAPVPASPAAQPTEPPAGGRSPPTSAAQESVLLTLRLPEADGPPGPVRLTVQPGGRAKVLALVRNQSGIVDNYELSVRGLPDGWWSITPSVVYLVPFGSGGQYEQEVEVEFHPPRTPEAQARSWDVEVVAGSAAHSGEVASAGATVLVSPYQELTATLRPERKRGRRRARFQLIADNYANAPLDVDLSGLDSEGACYFQFSTTHATLGPGQRAECPFKVGARKPIWIGRPVDRRFEVSAQAAGTEAAASRPGVFVQRPWIPWWVPIALPLLLLAAVMLWLLLPNNTTVPDVTKASTVFEAQKLLDDAKLKLSPQMQQRRVADARPGAIIDQTPAAGDEVEEGSEVTLLVAVGSGKRTVPNLVGLRPAQADKALRSAGLTLGAVQPQPPDVKAKIKSQIPVAEELVAAGTPVNVFLPPEGAGGGGGGGGGGEDVEVPEIEGLTLQEGSAKISEAGLVPKAVERLDAAKVGTVIGSVPGAGEKVAAGAAVRVIASAGLPQLAFDNGKDVFTISGAGGRATPVAKGAIVEEQPSWSADGRRIAYRGGQRIFVVEARKGATPVPVTAPGADFHNPSFAPQGDTLAVIKREADNGDLCFMSVSAGTPPGCIDDPNFDLSRQLRWAPDGSSLLAFAVDANEDQRFGLMRFTTTVPFSPNAADWDKGQLVTDVSRPGRGVVAGAISPDGKRLAVAANLKGSRFELFLTTAGDFVLSRAKALGARACELAWRPDGRELAVTQADSLCQERVGDLVRVDPRNPDKPAPLRSEAAQPSWQPARRGR
jgi:beta-lactam-binding protein with PASTA domain